jgi:hypothetical protein
MAGKVKVDFTDPTNLLIVEGMARDGLDNKDIAKYFNYTEWQFSRLVRAENKDNPGEPSQLAQALRKGRKPLEIIVENSLFKRATGMKVKTITKRWMILPDGTKTDTEIIQETESELPPDTGAAAVWLKQKKPEIWNKQPVKIESNVNNTDPFVQMLKAIQENTPNES